MAPGAAGAFRRQVLARAQPVTAADIEARLAHLRQVFDAVQLFVAPSRSIADAHERLGLHRSKLLVSDYGFVPQSLRPTSGANPERAELSDASRRARLSPLASRLSRIGFVGTLVWHKGLHVLLEAARELPASAYEIEVWGALDTFPDYTASLRAMARGLPVQFRGAFHNGQGAEVYRRFDLLVVPSLWPENSPLVIHEAFMAGVPVVAARIGGIPELVDRRRQRRALRCGIAGGARGHAARSHSQAGPPRGDGQPRTGREDNRRGRAGLGAALRVALWRSWRRLQHPFSRRARSAARRC